MKLPVKFITAVAALALLVVGVVSVHNAGNTAQAAVTGSVHLTNQWSDLTTNASPPSGRTYVGSGKTLYATFEDKSSDGATNENTIMSGSDTLVISVSDADLDLAQTVSETATLTNVDTNEQSTIVITLAAKKPIVSAVGDIVVKYAGNDADITSNFGVTVGNTGESGNAVVTLTNVVDVDILEGDANDDSLAIYLEYETSAVDLIDVEITTTVQTTPSKLTLRETGRSTGVFEGLVTLLDNGDTTSSATDTTSAATTACVDAHGTPGGTCLTAAVKVLDNSTVTVKYTDGLNASSNSQTITQTARVEGSAPVPVISSPTNAASIQVRNPSFSGSVSDSGSGLKIDQLILYIDQSDDPDNTVNSALAASPGSNLGIITGIGEGADVRKPTVNKTGTPTDGATTVSWSAAPTVNLPAPGGTALTGTIDHIIDFQFSAVDLAGNVGFSDSDTASDSLGAGTGTDNHDAHTVNIDQANPEPSAAFTGQTWDAETSSIDTTANNKRSIRVRFNDNVSGVDNTDFEVELDSGTTVIPISAQVFSGSANDVFLTLGVDMPSDDTPIVRIVGQVSDDAGNTASAGDVTAEDKLAPVITVALSGGSGTGTGTDGPTGLTKQTMVITISADETLSSTPTVDIFAADDAATKEGSVIAIAQSSTQWIASFNGSGFADSSAKAKKSVFVTASDNASTGVNTREVGKKDDAASGAITFTLDKTAPTLATGATTTSQRKPFVVIEFTDAHTVVVNTATVGGTDVLSQLATTDNKKFFYVPATDLALGDITVEGKATDVAGNEGTLSSYTLTVTERKAFSLDLFAGWNAKSFPSNPVDPAIGSVFTNTAIDQVVRYNAMDTASPWRIATRDAVSGNWTSSTSTPLNTIQTGRGYWIHTNNFAPQEVFLEGEVAPGSGSPPPVVTISTARGWNFVGITSQSRVQTTGSTSPVVALERITSTGGTNTVDVSEYFNTVNEGRVYRYDPATLQFRELAAGDAVNIGEALWVFISPQADGSLPAIVP